MSSTNYDVELNIAYDYNHRHYIPNYLVSTPSYRREHFSSYKWGGGYYYWVKEYWDYYVSFDSGSETHVEGEYTTGKSTSGYPDPPSPFWNNYLGVNIPDMGVFSKVYIRNGQRGVSTQFTPSTCRVAVDYATKAAFEVQFNSTGFAANQNPTFRCSTKQKNTYKQYEWVSAIVYYKKSTESSYSSKNATVSGTWSDVTVSTSGLTLQDGVNYNIYIRATADDGTVANTPVGTFNTVDAAAVATCISPSGAFISGDCAFIWSHSTAYGTPQKAYDLQYSTNNGGSWVTLKSHEVTSSTTTSTTLTNAGVYIWRVRTYNSNDVAGDWGQASFVNNVPVTPPTNLIVSTKGRPTVTWAATSQSAYQIQFVLNGENVAYDSEAVYSTETSHFVNKYFDDSRSYTVRLRIYNALGEVSDWIETGYQQPEIEDVEFEISSNRNGGAIIEVTPNNEFLKYYLLKDEKLIAEIEDFTFTDKYSIGLTNYSVIGVTSSDQSDIKTQGYVVKYPKATITTLDGQNITINKRVDTAFSISTTVGASINNVEFLGDSTPTHYASKMKVKSFDVSFYDEQRIAESLLGTVVFYADNFGNGGYCMVTNYNKTDNFVKDINGNYANETSLTLEVTNYDDSIEYPI